MKKLILILFLVSPVEAQTFKWYPIERDYPNSEYGVLKYDKLDHFAGHVLLTMVIPVKKYNLDFWGSVFAGVIYEINDGFEWRRTNGFSWVDLIFGISGSITGVFLKDLLHEFGIYILINKNGISINF